MSSVSAVPTSSISPTENTSPAWRTKRQHLEQRLIQQLKTAFPQVIPNHARPLNGRVVEYRATESGKRAVTDYELAGARTFGIPALPEFIGARFEAGQRIRQTWYWTVGAMHFRYNGYWATRPYFGYQYQSKCALCGDDIWTSCDRLATERCPKCRWTSGACSVHTKIACATAYKSHGCRCEVCRAWNADRKRRWKASNTIGSNKRKTIKSSKQFLSCTSLITTNGVTGSRPETWIWLPLELRTHIALHASVVHAVKEAARHNTGSQEYWDRTQTQLNIVTA